MNGLLRRILHNSVLFHRNPYAAVRRDNFRIFIVQVFAPIRPVSMTYFFLSIVEVVVKKNLEISRNNLN